MSFDIALSGIQAINEQLTHFSNNIANAGTYGFKQQPRQLLVDVRRRPRHRRRNRFDHAKHRASTAAC